MANFSFAVLLKSKVWFQTSFVSHKYDSNPWRGERGRVNVISTEQTEGIIMNKRQRIQTSLTEVKYISSISTSSTYSLINSFRTNQTNLPETFLLIDEHKRLIIKGFKLQMN